MKSPLRSSQVLALVAFAFLSFFSWLGYAGVPSNGAASGALSIESSMTKDPEAMACLIRACQSASRTTLVNTTGRSEFEMEREACKTAHLIRVRNALARDSTGPLLQPLSTDVSDTSLLRQIMSCRVPLPAPTPPIEKLDIAEEARRVIPRHALPQLAMRHVAGPPPVPALTKSAPVKTLPSQNVQVTVGPSERFPAAAFQPRPRLTRPRLKTATVEGCTLPPHFSLISQTSDQLTLAVEPGADFGALTRTACLSEHYELEADRVVATNPVEVTIPYCLQGTKRRFSPSRFADVLAGKKKLVIGGPADTSFVANCYAKKYIAGVALQEGQRLILKSRRREPTALKSSTAVSSEVRNGLTEVYSIVPVCGQGTVLSTWFSPTGDPLDPLQPPLQEACICSRIPSSSEEDLALNSPGSLLTITPGHDAFGSPSRSLLPP